MDCRHSCVFFRLEIRRRVATIFIARKDDPSDSVSTTFQFRMSTFSIWADVTIQIRPEGLRPPLKVREEPRVKVLLLLERTRHSQFLARASDPHRHTDLRARQHGARAVE